MKKTMGRKHKLNSCEINGEICLDCYSKNIPKTPTKPMNEGWEDQIKYILRGYEEDPYGVEMSVKSFIRTTLQEERDKYEKIIDTILKTKSAAKKEEIEGAIKKEKKKWKEESCNCLCSACKDCASTQP